LHWTSFFAVERGRSIPLAAVDLTAVDEVSLAG
jgi:hypothetical protein